MNRFKLLSLILVAFLSSSIAKATEDNWLKVNDSLTMVFYQWGEGTKSVVFIHGWSNDKTLWSNSQVFLGDSYQTVAVDLPRFGLSTTLRSNCSIGFYSSSILSVVEELKLDSIIFVGFSMGAGIVIETANRIPDKTLGVIIVDHFHNIDIPIPDSVLAGFADMYMDIVQNPTLEKLQPFVQTNQEKFLNQMKFKMSEQKMKGWRETFIEYAHWINNDLKESLKKLQCPIAAINTLHPETDIEAFQKVVPSFKVKFVENSGHLIMWDAPDRFNKLLEETITEITQQN